MLDKCVNVIMGGIINFALKNKYIAKFCQVTNCHKRWQVGFLVNKI